MGSAGKRFSLLYAAVKLAQSAVQTTFGSQLYQHYNSHVSRPNTDILNKVIKLQASKLNIDIHKKQGYSYKLQNII